MSEDDKLDFDIGEFSEACEAGYCDYYVQPYEREKIGKKFEDGRVRHLDFILLTLKECCQAIDKINEKISRDLEYQEKEIDFLNDELKYWKDASMKFHNKITDEVIEINKKISKNSEPTAKEIELPEDA